MLDQIKIAGKLSAAEFALLTSRLESRAFNKGEYFLEIGNINASLGFIEKGLAMYYRLINGTTC